MMTRPVRFASRRAAGAQLARRLLHCRAHNPLVLALPRGGVPVGVEIARALEAPLDMLIVRKVSAPGGEEFAIGALAEGNPPELFIDSDLRAALSVPGGYIEDASAAAAREIERRRLVYRGGRAMPPVAGRWVVLVDDGIATGATMQAAVRALKRLGPERVILAVPVAAADALARLQPEVDEIACLRQATDLHAVGQFYLDFAQLEDAEVCADLAAAAAFGGGFDESKITR